MLFKILSLDGGGTWALIEVMALQAIYGPSAKGHSILRRFDLVTANSGGSIVVAAMVADMALDDILKFFLDDDKREEIFVRVPLLCWLNPVRVIVGGPKYVTTAKLDGLASLLGPMCTSLKLPSVPAMVGPNYQGKNVHFLIPAFDYDRKRHIFFRSNLGSLASNFPRLVVTPSDAVTIVQAVHASSTAPVKFFDEPADFSNHRYWDGGVAGYNNPVFAGVVEALANNVPTKEIMAFSLGTGTLYRPLDGRVVDDILLQTKNDPSISGDLGILAQSILDDPPDTAIFEAHVVLGQPLPSIGGVCISDGSVIRLSPLIQPIRNNPGSPWDFPKGFDQQSFGQLARLGMDALEPDDVHLIQAFAKAWTNGDIRNQPIRTNQNLECEIGHSDFRAAAKLM